MARRSADRLPESAPHDLTGALQGYYAVEVLLQLQRVGVLGGLVEGRRAGELARPLGLNARLLAELLEFAARTTNIVVQDRRGRYRLGASSLPEVVFQLEKFAGAYGPVVRGIPCHLRGQAGATVDEGAMATAFAAAGDEGGPVVALAQGAGVRALLDLGCGPATLLIRLAAGDSEFRGWGIDASAAMCRLARVRARAAGVGRRVQVLHADARCPERVLKKDDRRKIDAVHGRSFLNELFGRGDKLAVSVLRRLRRLFPGRVAWFVDYYGELGRARHSLDERRLALLQDLAQAVSGQGVPPPDGKSWQKVYGQAGCRLNDCQEYEGGGIRWFVHTVQL